METGRNRETESTPLQIDLDAILRGRMSGKTSRWIPRWATRLLERVVCQDELNRLLRTAFPYAGSDFSDAILRELDITLDVRGEDVIPPHGRFIFVSNHPLGGLDGIALIKVLGERYGDENIRFLVNDLLMNVRPLKNIFLPINKFGSQGRKAAEIIQATYASDRQMLIFPAGLVSRRHRNGIRDLEWRKTFVSQALRHSRTVIPLFFDALNSPRFYNTAWYREKMGIKVNLEQALLPSELCRSHGKSFRIIFGKPITPEALAALGATDKDRAAAVKDIVYGLNPLSR